MVALEDRLPADRAAAARAYAAWLRDRFGSRLRSVLLFGSYARGGPIHDESDIDILVLVDGMTWDERHEAMRAAGRFHRWFEGIAMPTAEFEHLKRRERLFARDVEAEGIEIRP